MVTVGAMVTDIDHITATVDTSLNKYWHSSEECSAPQFYQQISKLAIYWT